MEHCDTRVELYESTVEHFDTIVEVLTQQWSTVSKTMMHNYNTIEQYDTTVENCDTTV